MVSEKAEEPEIKWPTSAGSLKKQERSRKTSISALLTALKPLIVDHNKLWTILKDMGIPDHLTCMQVRKQQLELDMEQQIVSKLEKGVSQSCILSPCLFILYSEYIMRNFGLDEVQAGIRIAGRNTSDMQMTPPFWQKVQKN